MKKGLTKARVREIYDRTAAYYNIFHRLGTMGLDEKGRNLLVEKTVSPGDYVLDAGGGTGLTAFKAAEKAGGNGKVVLLDLSEGMLAEAERKIEKSGLGKNMVVKQGDMVRIPFPAETFDTVLSSYSTCPLEDPLHAVREMLRVLKTGGLLGIVHSTEAENRVVRRISNQIENFIWKFPRLSLGCRAISLTEGLRSLNADIMEQKTIGFIPFFFKILVIKKRPDAAD